MTVQRLSNQDNTGEKEYATGYPVGVTVSFNPDVIAKPGTGTSAMKVKVGAKVKAGNYSITLNVSGGGVTHTLAFVLGVKP